MNDNIVMIQYQDKEIYLVKTAHVSKNSVEDVVSCFEEVDPDTICIELDEQRLKSLEDRDAWRNTDIVEVIRKKQAVYLLVNTILSSFQRRMAKQMDSSSGAEMVKGIELSRQHDKNLVLADRPVKTTFSRIWAKLGTYEKAKLIVSIVSSIFDDEEISEEELAQLKNSDALETALQEVGKEFPMVKKVLVDERDCYLAEKIRNAPGKKIRAIIGAAHAAGIQRHLYEEIDTAELEDIPKKKGIASLIKWLIPALLIFMVIYTLLHNKDVGISQLKSWILWNGSLSAAGVLIAGGHILTALTAFVMTPITSLNPLLAAGWFAGIVEATLRKPKVKDFEDIAEDTATFKGFFRNGVTRILLIVVFANVFSTIATLISGLDIVRSFLDILFN